MTERTIGEVNDQVAARGGNTSGKTAFQMADELGAPRPAPTAPAAQAELAAFDRMSGPTLGPNAADQARGRLQSINAGKDKFDGWLKGAAVGSVIPGVNTIAQPVAAALGGIRAAGTNFPAAMGRAIEGAGKKIQTPAAMQGWFANPAILPQLAKQNGKLGSAARYALEGLQQGGEGGLKSRMFVLSLQPWFREMSASHTETPEVTDAGSSTY